MICLVTIGILGNIVVICFTCACCCSFKHALWKFACSICIIFSVYKENPVIALADFFNRIGANICKIYKFFVLSIRTFIWRVIISLSVDYNRICVFAFFFCQCIRTMACFVECKIFTALGINLVKCCVA